MKRTANNNSDHEMRIARMMDSGPRLSAAVSAASSSSSPAQFCCRFMAGKLGVAAAARELLYLHPLKICISTHTHTERYTHSELANKL